MSVRLSKSRFQTGLQCPKALWLTAHARELADPVPETRQHVFDTGTAVGELARERFGGGLLIEEDHLHSAEALETTAAVLLDSPAALFEGAFEFGGVFVRPDALVRVEDGQWDLYEVKSGTRVKRENITDVAVQAWVLEGAGLRLRRLHLMHLDKTYVHDGGSYDLDRLFLAEDVTEQARAFIAEVPGLVAQMQRMLAGPEPQVAIGKHCDTPYTCAFHGHCHAHLPRYPVTKLPRVSTSLLDSLVAAGILDIADVPLDFPGLTAQQREVIELVRSGVPRVVGDPRKALSALTYPVHFIDFETFMSALPLYPGTRPWQMIPFQWSDHVLHENGDVAHLEFLHTGSDDPRARFADSLIEALGDTGSVVVYSPFEKSRLNELASALPGRADRIAAIQRRIFDLLDVVRAHVRHPETMGSSSIKAILPALVDDLTYDDLAIAEGQVASVRYLTAVRGDLEPEECERIFADLRAYCGTDTLAMVRLCGVLMDG